MGAGLPEAGERDPETLCRSWADTLQAIPGKAIYLASLLLLWGGTKTGLPHRISNSDQRKTACSPKAQDLSSPLPPHPTPPGPGALPGGAEEFMVVGAEAVGGGGAAATGALVSGGNIRSCFLTFSFLR